MEFILSNWVAILLGLLFIAWQIARLTPSEKDDKIIKIIMKIVQSTLTVIPDNKKGGGKWVIENTSKKIDKILK